ncbi:glycoside hydrolase family 88 protein [Paenibacillus koleovorans]|uniref:glycoside hydrolase family 88 protein n=1 Tax=Paenibacillus koleovorans TaxID=121608 RepID=UPI000FD8880E|nr:glycoside hydrolase family 88 protein [Paenibacillus koleovorans]
MTISGKLLEKYKAVCEFAPTLPIPSGQRVPYGWGTAAIDSSDSKRATTLKWSGLPASDSDCSVFLRLCIACDVREEKRIDVALSESGRVLATFDIRYGYVTQIYEVPLPAEAIPAVASEGLSLLMVEGNRPLWMFYQPDSASDSAGIPATMQPHLLISGGVDRLSEFYTQFRSVTSIQPFGWLEGCVLDGLYQLELAAPNQGWKDTALNHLQLYFPTGDTLVMEDHFGQVSDNVFYLDESTLPIAVIAEVWPDHPVLDRAIEYWLSTEHALTAEGCYTMAYPITVLAWQRKDAELGRWALRLLRERMDELADDKGLWQCYRPGSNADRYRDWARAYAWYMLGLTRSLMNLQQLGASEVPGLETLEPEIRRVAAHLIALQGEDGLWACFVDDPATGADTSGSAGIAAALALGASHGKLPDEARRSAEKAFVGLQAYLTPDGLLAGVAQNNRGGEALQKSGYRVISQMAMGLMGQLAGALGRTP